LPVQSNNKSPELVSAIVDTFTFSYSMSII
jgi:hypothetical protein